MIDTSAGCIQSNVCILQLDAQCFVSCVVVRGVITVVDICDANGCEYDDDTYDDLNNEAPAFEYSIDG